MPSPRSSGNRRSAKSLAEATKRKEEAARALDAAEASKKAADDAARPAIVEALKAAQQERVRANLVAWLANRASQPESRLAWLEEQCRIVGLL